MGEDFAHGVLLDQLTITNDRHAVADTFNHVHFMGDQQDGQSQATVNVFQQFENGTGSGRIGALVASSHSNTLGLLASARAIATRCFWPPERLAG